ncbi:radical SAM protein [archaeon]|nr:MAG: radical SAM protein [archaeon]
MPGVRTVAMTTNGVALSPAKAKALHAAGLSCINISLDTLQRTRFEAVSRRPASYWDATRRAIDAALALPFDSVKLNCVLLRGVNDDELAEFVELTRSQPLHVRFIELMPFGGNAWTSDKFLAAGEAIASLQQRYPSMHPLGVDGTSQRFGIDGHAGSVGFIASMSAAFCATCDRLRLTADGNVRACLHGAHEVPMKHLLEAGDVDGLRAAVRSALGAKHAALGGEAGMHALSRAAQHADARPMIKIGG